MKPEKTGRRCVLILLILLAAVFFLSFLLGRYRVSALQTARLLADRALSGVSRGHLRLAPTWTPEEASVVIQIRLPRILSAALIGAALSAAGASYQAMFRNPMVSPDLLGASTGACFGAALAILLGASYAVITAGSFLFGLAAVGLTYLVGRLSRMRSNLAMVLAGVMVGSLFSAGTSFIKLVADTNEQLPAITYWLMGALTAVQAATICILPMVPILLGLIPLLFLRWRLNLLTISEAEARSMGVNTKLLRLAVIVCATLATAASVSISGMIGWVGLVIPHICRLLVGQDYRLLLPCSMLLGASFLMLVDDLARCLTTSEIPLGILTALVGAPLFLYLIVKGGARRCSLRYQILSFSYGEADVSEKRQLLRGQGRTSLPCSARTAWEKARSSAACSAFWSRSAAASKSRAATCGTIPAARWRRSLPIFRSPTVRRSTIRCSTAF